MNLDAKLSQVGEKSLLCGCCCDVQPNNEGFHKIKKFILFEIFPNLISANAIKRNQLYGE